MTAFPWERGSRGWSHWVCLLQQPHTAVNTTATRYSPHLTDKKTEAQRGGGERVSNWELRPLEA